MADPKLINGSDDSNHSSKFTVLDVAAFTKKRRQENTKQTHNPLLNSRMFEWESYLFCASRKCRFMESRNQQHDAYC